MRCFHTAHKLPASGKARAGVFRGFAHPCERAEHREALHLFSKKIIPPQLLVRTRLKEIFCIRLADAARLRAGIPAGNVIVAAAVSPIVGAMEVFSIALKQHDVAVPGLFKDDNIAGLQQRIENGQIGIGAGVRLHVGMLRAK